MLADGPALQHPVGAVRVPGERFAAPDGRVALTRLEAAGGGAVDVGSLQLGGISIGQVIKTGVKGGKGGELGVGDAALGDSEEVEVAGSGIEVAQRERAAQVDADEVVAEDVVDAGEVGIEHFGNLAGGAVGVLEIGPGDGIQSFEHALALFFAHDFTGR